MAANLQLRMISKQNISYSVYTTWRKYSSIQEARILNKLISKGERLKKKPMPNSTSMNQYARRILYSQVPKRHNILNKVFMEHVSTLMSIGEYSEELSNLGIQVLKARISPNLHVLFLYWIHTKPTIDEEKVLVLLPVVARQIRYELSTMRIIGQVPEVRFVKHEQITEMQHLEKLLNDLSFLREIGGEELKKNENEGLKCKENEEPVVNTYNSLKIDRTLSTVKQNMCNLDYPKVLQNILKEKMKRQPDAWERRSTPHISGQGGEDIKFDKKMLTKMILKKTYELRKQRRLNKQLIGIIEEDQQNSQLEEENDEEYCTFDDDNETYDDGDVNEEEREIYDKLMNEDELTDTKDK